MKKNRISSIIIKALLILFAVIGLYVTFNASGFMSASALLYFTVQSNIWILLIFAVFIVFELLNKSDSIPRWLRAVKFIFTSAISLTFVVFSVLLTPQMIIEGNSDYLWSLGNICVHNAVPILAIIDWCIFDYKYKTMKNSYILGVVMPLYYCGFALIGSLVPFDFGDGKKVPYFFFDYEANTWFQIGNGKFGSFYWIMILVGIVFGISYVLIYIKNKREKRSEK